MDSRMLVVAVYCCSICFSCSSSSQSPHHDDAGAAADASTLDFESQDVLRAEPVMDLPGEIGLSPDFGDDRFAFVCEDLTGDQPYRFRLETTSGAGACGTDFSPGDSLVFATFQWIADRDELQVLGGQKSVDGGVVAVEFQSATHGTITDDPTIIQDVPPGEQITLTTIRWSIRFEVGPSSLKIQQFRAR